MNSLSAFKRTTPMILSTIQSLSIKNLPPIQVRLFLHFCLFCSNFLLSRNPRIHQIAAQSQWKETRSCVSSTIGQLRADRAVQADCHSRHDQQHQAWVSATHSVQSILKSKIISARTKIQTRMIRRQTKPRTVSRRFTPAVALTTRTNHRPIQRMTQASKVPQLPRQQSMPLPWRWTKII